MPPHRAIVIGTGFGGAVTACRLAQAGVRVDVLERGRRYRGGDFPRGPIGENLDRWLWNEGFGLYDVRPFTGMQIAQAAGYGGGSLIYANVHLRPPPEVFEKGWPRGYSREELEPYYDLVDYMLATEPITALPGELPPKTRQMTEAAQQLGRRAQTFHPRLSINLSGDTTLRPNRFGVPQRRCVQCGECIAGCPHEAKNTLDHNYLALAEQHGARMHPLCEVRRIEYHDEGRRPYYRVYYLDYASEERHLDHAVEKRRLDHAAEERRARGPAPLPTSGQPVTALDVEKELFLPDDRLEHLDAEHVFLCAGAVNSTELLLRCRAQGHLPRLSPRLGERYSGNGDLLAFTFQTREAFAPHRGPTITTGLLYQRDEQWFLVEEGGFPVDFWPLVSLMTPWAEARVRMERVEELRFARLPPARPAELNALLRQRLEPTERVVALEGAPALEAAPSPEMDHTGVFLAMGRDLADGRISLLADQFLHIDWNTESHLGLYQTEARLCADLSEALGGRFAENPFWRLLHIPISVHNLGGCPMGAGPEEGVTSDVGEVFGYENLFVLDGAILPVATGTNPSHTIAAVAERNIERIVRRMTAEPTWTAPQRAQARPVSDPLADVQIPPDGSALPATPAPGVSMRLSLRGAWEDSIGRARAPVRFMGKLLIVDVERFLAEPAHAGIIEGSLHVVGLTDGPTRVRHGVCNLLVPREDGASRGRIIRLALPFVDHRQRPHVLFAEAAVATATGRGLLAALSRLKVTLFVGDTRSGPPLGRGTVGLTWLDVLASVLSLRGLGPYGTIEHIRTSLRFLRFLILHRAPAPSAEVR